MNGDRMENAFKFLKHRRATEEETRDYYEARRSIHRDATERELRGIERMQYVTKRMRELSFYYCLPLDCVMYDPTMDEVFKHWARAEKIEASEMAAARKAWNAAWDYYRQPNYDDETLAQHRAGQKIIRNMRPEDATERRAAHERRYSEKIK